jgi:hypothetical protein
MISFLTHHIAQFNDFLIHFVTLTQLPTQHCLHLQAFVHSNDGVLPIVQTLARLRPLL